MTNDCEEESGLDYSEGRLFKIVLRVALDDFQINLETFHSYMGVGESLLAVKRN